MFDYMLKNEGNADPCMLAYDKQLHQLLSILDKYFGLRDYTPQNNNFVVYEDYFQNESKRILKTFKAKLNDKDTNYYCLGKEKYREDFSNIDNDNDKVSKYIEGISRSQGLSGGQLEMSIIEEEYDVKIFICDYQSKFLDIKGVEIREEKGREGNNCLYIKQNQFQDHYDECTIKGNIQDVIANGDCIFNSIINSAKSQNVPGTLKNESVENIRHKIAKHIYDKKDLFKEQILMSMNSYKFSERKKLSLTSAEDQEKISIYGFASSQLPNTKFGDFKTQLHKLAYGKALLSGEELEKAKEFHMKLSALKQKSFDSNSIGISEDDIKDYLNAVVIFMENITENSKLEEEMNDYVNVVKKGSKLIKRNENLGGTGNPDNKITLDLNVRKLNLEKNGITLRSYICGLTKGKQILELMDKINSLDQLKKGYCNLFGIQIGKDVIIPEMGPENTNFRVLYYPSCESVSQETSRCGLHSDYGVFSLIFQKPYSGLFTISDDFQHLIEAKDYCVPVIGAAASHLLGLKPTYHEVIASPKMDKRVSIVLFVDPLENVLMSRIN
eukprot:CAMPEP_0170536880 /NCGR_PEP_ID=MMETSP0209-20121228/102395_1 /TAXON_ID=665100 ORGANISM="Litonotus pictus, Strain P1" /NCGR_SAMPLE_ID=MMETSP0209 /ASSEMBLY_ACC=CAM_ASM_000301 /LENGTH=554 /DNA_ID=CAMNT_0010838295 /DNA_START=880 /DNA_END=2544 /DNA_ORIENTATION=-